MRLMLSVCNPLLRAAACACLALLSAQPALSNEKTLFQIINVQDGSGLNIRKNPSPVAPSLGVIPAASNLNIVSYGCLALPGSSNASWCEVQWNGIRGWASSEFLTEIYAGPEVGTGVQKPSAANTLSAADEAATAAQEVDAEFNILDLPDATIVKPGYEATALVSEPAEPKLPEPKLTQPEASEPTISNSGRVTPAASSLFVPSANEPITAEARTEPQQQQEPGEPKPEQQGLDGLRQPLPPFMGRPYNDRSQ